MYHIFYLCIIFHIDIITHTYKNAMCIHQLAHRCYALILGRAQGIDALILHRGVDLYVNNPAIHTGAMLFDHKRLEARENSFWFLKLIRKNSLDIFIQERCLKRRKLSNEKTDSIMIQCIHCPVEKYSNNFNISPSYEREHKRQKRGNYIKRDEQSFLKYS